MNPRQYVAQIPQLSNVEVWFQRPKDVVRKILSGDLDLGIVGLDTVSEYGQVVTYQCSGLNVIKLCDAESIDLFSWCNCWF